MAYRNSVEEFTKRQREFDLLEAKVNAHQRPDAIPPDLYETVRELMFVCLDIERKALEAERRDLKHIVV